MLHVSKQSYELGTIMGMQVLLGTILEMQKLNFRKVWKYVQGHMVPEPGL